MIQNFPFKHFFSISFFTLLSKVFGFAREWVRAFFFGITDQADIFLMAYRIPFFFYKICSEGPLNAALVPFVTDMKQTQNITLMMRIITCSMIIVQSFFLGISLLIMGVSHKIVTILAPGWENSSSLTEVISLIPILMSSMIFMSSSFYLSAVLQGSAIFSAILMQPILLNILLIIEYGVCWYYSLSLYVLSLCYLINSLVLFGATWLIFRKHHILDWSFDSAVIRKSLNLIKKIFTTSITIGATEINTIIDLQFASFFGPGTLALMNNSGIILRIPLSIFGACFSMVLLPKFSAIKHDKQLLNSYLKDSLKLLLIAIIPIIIIMYITAPYIFLFMFRFSQVHSMQAAQFLRFSLVGLFFFCFNRILLNVYYSIDRLSLPTYISLATIAANIGFNMILPKIYGASGIMLSTSCASILQCCLLIIFLKFDTAFYFLSLIPHNPLNIRFISLLYKNARNYWIRS